MGQDFCPACISFAKDDGDPAWSREADEYYHASALCAGIEDEAAEAETALTFVARARLRGKLPCPNCATQEQTTPAILTGLLYCTAESNSDVQIKAAKKELDKLGLEYTDFTVSSSNEIQSVVESAVGKVDALYSPTDNTIAAGASQVGQICKENKLPFVTGEEGMCMAGGLFTLSINYEDLGYAAGEMAVKILKGEAKPEDMPIKHLSSKDLVVVKNDEMAEALGIDLSALDA